MRSAERLDDCADVMVPRSIAGRPSSIDGMTGRVELARQQWEQAYRELACEPGSNGIDDRAREQIEIVAEELRRKLGGPFTLGELVDVYDGSARWTYDIIAERRPRPGWARSAATAADAAFHLYARGARDYRP